MQFHEFYKSVYAIMRIENGNGRLVGTASVISAKPVQLLTCHHVVSEANATNSAPVHYSITKRSDQGIDFDLRNASAAWLHVSAIALKPDADLAILTVDPTSDANVAKWLGLDQPTPLPVSFDPDHRQIGDDVEWLTPAVSIDALTPRYFRGHIITHYISTTRVTKLPMRNNKG